MANRLAIKQEIDDSLQDDQILNLLFERNEAALEQIEKDYGSMLEGIAIRWTGTREIAEECKNDTLLTAWRSIPPARPANLKAWLAKTVRNHAVSRYRAETAEKRGSGEVGTLDELAEIVPDKNDVESTMEAQELSKAIDKWLRTLDANERRMFVQRYFYGMPLNEVAEEFGEAPQRVADIMHRLRGKLKTYLEDKGVWQ